MANDKIVYSQSRLCSFDDCKLKYKYHYIDRLESDIDTIEAFRGSVVHKVLEELYKLVKVGTVKPLEWAVGLYDDTWKKNYHENIKIVKKGVTVDGYYQKGREAVISYYERYKPFDQAKVVDTERMIRFTLRNGKEEYAFLGILDRLDWNDKTQMFEIHDYKTTSSLMTQEQADTDWQLGLYQIALKEKWPDTKEVKLVWHSLLFNKEIISSRTEMQLETLQKAVIDEIKKIEECVEFPPNKSALCDWCEYQVICPLWKHPIEAAALPVNEYKKEPGVKLVTKYAELESTKKELQEKIALVEAEEKKIEEAAIEFAEENKVIIIDGPDNQLKVEIKKELKAPTKTDDAQAWQGLRDALIKEGKYNEVSTVNNNMLNYRIRIWPKEFLKKIEAFLKRQVIKSVKLIKK
jgi:putative RecB family exonuclease